MNKQWTPVYHTVPKGDWGIQYFASFCPLMGYRIVTKFTKVKSQNNFNLFIKPNDSNEFWSMKGVSFQGNVRQHSGLTSISPSIVRVMSSILRHWDNKGKRSWKRNAAARAADLDEFKQRSQIARRQLAAS